MFVLRFYPCHQYGYGILLFFIGEFSSGGDVMPFVKASSATAAGGVLSEEHWMASHWCLLAVVQNNSWSQSFGDEVFRVSADGGQTFLGDVLFVFLCQMESTAEVGLGEPCEQVCQVVLFAGERFELLFVIFRFFLE